MRLFSLLLLPILMGCGDPPPRLVPKVTQVELPPKSQEAYANDFGQLVEQVLVAEMAVWFTEHKDCEIVSITAVSMSANSTGNPTTCFLVVYVRRTKERL